jgi:Fic family protein
MTSDQERATAAGGRLVSWPPLQTETVPWESRLDLGTASRSQRQKHRGSYQAAVPLMIAERHLDLRDEVLAAAEDASHEIARFDTELGAEIALFGAVLLRSESAASSQIENLTASARAIAEAEIGGVGRQNAAQIVANTRAMNAAIAMADRLDAASILAMHQVLMELAEPKIAGKWRQEQVWVGGTSLGPHGALFVPPHYSRVEPAIDDLMSFIRRDDLPVLAQAAVAHAQFETIHPFPDGNGRIGRALLHAMLRNKGLARNVTVPVSAGLLTDTQAYFAALTVYRTGDLSAMVHQLSDASFAAIANGRELVSQLREIRAGWSDRVSARRDSAAWRLADLLTRQPVINARLVAAELGVAANNVYRLIEPFEEAGVLTEFTDRQRNRVWRTPEILAALDAFAVRAGRRRLTT